MVDEPNVTLVIVPRERFGSSVASLESVYANTSMPFRVIYIDGNSPQSTARELLKQSKLKGFELIRENKFLTANKARNLGLARVSTKYVVFLDNDVFVTPGWLERMIECAEETGADIVSPLYLEGKLERRIIHMANAVSKIEVRDGKKYYIEDRLLASQKLDAVSHNLSREQSNLFEFHCVLMRTDLFAIPDLMPEHVSNLEHSHLSMRVLALGKKIYFEPSSVLTYDYSYPFYISDLPFFHYRWSHALSTQSLMFFKKFWDLSDDDPFIPNALQWVADHRRVPRLNSALAQRFFGSKGTSVFERAFLKLYRDYANYKNTRDFRVRHSI